MTAALRFAAALAVTAALPAHAHAGGGITAAASARYRADDGGPDTAALAVQLRIWQAPGWAGGLDLAAGGGPEGFAYEAVAWPVGLAVRASRWLDVAVRAGGGITGLTGTRELGAPLGGELTGDLALHARAHLTLSARLHWVALAASRDAALAWVGADELTVMAGLRFGRTMREYNGAAGRGLVIQAALHRDGAGSAVIVGIGIGADVRWTDSPARFPGWLR